MINTTKIFNDTLVASLALLQRNLLEIAGLLNITVISQKTVTAVTAEGISFIHLELFNYTLCSSVGVEMCYDKLDRKLKTAGLCENNACQTCLRSEEQKQPK